MAVFFALVATVPAWAQSSFFDRLNAAVDTLRKGIQQLGKNTEDLIPPMTPLESVDPNDFKGLQLSLRDYEQSFQVRPSPRVLIEGEFGEIRVDSWDQPVVRVKAEITAGAESTAKAIEIANAIQIEAKQSESGLEIKTRYPEIQAPVEVNYLIVLPHDANVTCVNNFGDTVVHSVGGEVSVRSHNGRVELIDLAKPVKVETRGALSRLFAYRLNQGGEFLLQSTEAELKAVSGHLKVSSFLGKLHLREIAPNCTVEATTAGAPIHVYLNQNDQPHIEASALFGDVSSDLPMDRSTRRNMVVSQSNILESSQRLMLDSTFESIFVHVEGIPPAAGTVAGASGAHFEEAVPEARITPPANGKLLVEAATGDVRIEGSDGDTVAVTALKHVRVDAASKASTALRALTVAYATTEDAVRIRSALEGDLATLGASSYRIDLTIICPRAMAVEVVSASGHTTVANVDGTVKVAQTEGSIQTQSIGGAVDLRNAKGGVQALDSGGAVVVNASGGDIKTRNVQGPQEIVGQQSKVILEAPLGAVDIRNAGGDVRILALDGVRGDYEVFVEKGDLSIMLLPTSDATIWIKAVRGTVNPNNGVVLSGTIEKDIQRFQGSMNNGALHRVYLEATDGDVAID